MTLAPSTVRSTKAPIASSLRRLQIWKSAAHSRSFNPSLIPYHEAGHVIFLEWLGITNVKATNRHSSGDVCLSPTLFEVIPVVPRDPDGLLTATAAAMFHAGLAAELLLTDTPWTGPIFYPEQNDYVRADALLCESFGRNASGAHAFAQQLAMHVLSHRWPRVQEIANVLITSNAFQSEDWVGTINQN